MAEGKGVLSGVIQMIPGEHTSNTHFNFDTKLRADLLDLTRRKLLEQEYRLFLVNKVWLKLQQYACWNVLSINCTDYLLTQQKNKINSWVDREIDGWIDT